VAVGDMVVLHGACDGRAGADKVLWGILKQERLRDRLSSLVGSCTVDRTAVEQMQSKGCTVERQVKKLETVWFCSRVPVSGKTICRPVKKKKASPPRSSTRAPQVVYRLHQRDQHEL